jgi:hypothetical protein
VSGQRRSLQDRARRDQGIPPTAAPSRSACYIAYPGESVPTLKESPATEPPATGAPATEPEAAAAVEAVAASFPDAIADSGEAAKPDLLREVPVEHVLTRQLVDESPTELASALAIMSV